MTFEQELEFGQVVPRNASHKLIPLGSSSDEYEEVSQLFIDGWEASKGRNPPIQSILKIEYLENMTTSFRKYQSTLGSNRNERLLLTPVGTTCGLGEAQSSDLEACRDEECSLCSILRNRFGRELEQSSQFYRPFGSAIYSTPCSSWADEAMPRNSSSTHTRVLLVSRVICGKTFKTHNASMNLRKPPTGFNSITGIAGKGFPCEQVVVFRDDAALPAFLVVYGESPSQLGTFTSPRDESSTEALVVEAPDEVPTSEQVSSDESTSAIVVPTLAIDQPEYRAEVRGSQGEEPPSDITSVPQRDEVCPPYEDVLVSPTSTAVVSSESPVVEASIDDAAEVTHAIATSPSIIPVQGPFTCLLHSDSNCSHGDSRSSSISFSETCFAVTKLVHRMRINYGLFTVSEREIQARIEVLRLVVGSSDMSHEIAVLKAKGQAQKTLDVIQEILDHEDIWPSHRTPDVSKSDLIYSKLRNHLGQFQSSLSLATDLLPSSFVLSNVDCENVESIGAGSFADIYQGTYNGAQVALKRLRLFQTLGEEKIAELRKEFYHEALLWKNLLHKNILPFLGVDNSVFRDGFCMVLPWMQLGNIRSLIDDLREREDFTDRNLFLQIHRWIREIAEGLAYLHTEGIVHADLRGPNILIDTDWGVRLADFGMATFEEHVNGTLDSLVNGAVRWSAPELISPESVFENCPEDLDPRPTPATDVYSLACVIIELYTSQLPYREWSDTQILLRVPGGLRPERPTFLDGTIMPDALWTLMSKCWLHNPDERATAKEIVREMFKICEAL